MLIRFAIKNLFSFKELTEFNMLPGRYSQLPEHVYTRHIGIKALKMNVIYGANGSGKSNLVRAIGLLQKFISTGTMPPEFLTQTFKFDKESADKDVYLGIEFIANNIPFYYGLTINKGTILEEELLISGLGKRKDKVLFRRTDSSGEKNLRVIFSKEIETDKEVQQYSSILQNEILERGQPVLFYMERRQNMAFLPMQAAFNWLKDTLVIVNPDEKPIGIASDLENNKQFLDFATDTIKSFGTGITKIFIQSIPLEHYLGQENKVEIERITTHLRANPSDKWYDHHDDLISVVLENGKPVTKKICFIHNEDDAVFDYQEESDGTKRLIEYLPILYDAVNVPVTIVIDEIERSIHPLLIKELVKKFSHDNNTQGQLIFTTHESNLLDLDIFRQDEIWFAQKTMLGSTKLYPLSDYKEHHTIDIQKGYLNGRYGAIPFLGNLKDLKWNKYAKA